MSWDSANWHQSESSALNHRWARRPVYLEITTLCAQSHGRPFNTRFLSMQQLVDQLFWIRSPEAAGFTMLLDAGSWFVSLCSAWFLLPDRSLCDASHSGAKISNFMLHALESFHHQSRLLRSVSQSFMRVEFLRVMISDGNHASWTIGPYRSPFSGDLRTWSCLFNFAGAVWVNIVMITGFRSQQSLQVLPYLQSLVCLMSVTMAWHLL